MDRSTKYIKNGKFANKSTVQKLQVFTEYCTGCGLCKSQKGVSFLEDERGYSVPLLQEEDLSFCKSVCPAGGRFVAHMEGGKPWGAYKRIDLGWSTDAIIREKASSGGILTALCIYLLESGCVDGIIQTRCSQDCAYGTETVVSCSKEDVIGCMGSRYAISSPLSQINQIVQEGKSYAFVGKPCDVSALRMLLNDDPLLASKIKYLFAFFCAGQPSRKAQEKLLERLGCKDVAECAKLTYRGNGWPGFATVFKKNGETDKISYNESWGQILGRDIRKSCRFCYDGIGEMADISCGDAWFLLPDKTPDFQEHEGRNVIFSRTEKGRELLTSAEKAGYVFLSEYDPDELQYIQKFQYERRATMVGRIGALKLMRKVAPDYSLKIMMKSATFVGWKVKLKIFLGTIKRIYTGRI